MRDDKIAAIGNLKNATAAKVVDARGKYVTPGFIALQEHIDRGRSSRAGPGGRLS